MAKKCTSLFFALLICCCFSVPILAEDQDNPGANKILVDKMNNSITYIYDETDDDLMEQWNVLPHFNDVANDAWYQMYVSHLAQLGIIDSTVSNFYPEETISRKDYVRMIANVAALNVEKTSEIELSEDISQDFLENSAMQWALSSDIVSRDFIDEDPNDPLNMSEATEILIALSEYQNTDALSRYIENVARAEATAVAAGLKTIDSTIVLSDSTGDAIDREVISKKLLGSDVGIAATDIVRRCDAAKMISFYIVLKDKPDLFTGAALPIEYIGFNTTETDVLENSEGNTAWYNHFSSDDLQTLQGEISPNWTSRGDVNTSVHKRITNRGFLILFSDKNSSITNITGKYSPLARSYIYEGCVAPDYSDKRGETQRYSAGHYCSPTLRNKFDQSDLTAYTNFNNRYYEAKVYYDWKDWETSYDKLGRALHYMEDILSPPHAALIVGEKHREYEDWVMNNMRSEYFVYSAPSNTYSYMSTSTFRAISINFATYSAGVADECVYGSESLKIPFTKECLTKAQRAVAGMGYRFLIDTGRNN